MDKNLMKPVTLSAAAKLAGKSRATMYRLVKEGKISATQNAQGEKVVDVSELQRVFGELQPVSNDNLKPESVKQGDNLKIQHENAMLAVQVNALEKENALLVQQLKTAEKQNERFIALLESRLLVQLPAPPGQSPEAPAIQAPKKKKKGEKKGKKRR
ncbi:MAG: hypothetical protein GY862_37690 [Gammaproteobacteria bacterium]|nr:hypothetical protein [Gammaproteobacteria bacterium]